MIANNSIVTEFEIGARTYTALLCYTNLQRCCHATNTDSTPIGQWYYPDGNVVPNMACAESKNLSAYRNRGNNWIRLNRYGNETLETGIYECKIPADMRGNVSIFVGVYHKMAG